MTPSPSAPASASGRAVSAAGATIVFQSIINNTIVTPCLLGMNALYSLIHTVVAFAAGMGSAIMLNADLSFSVDLLIMGVTATLLYGYLFKKTRYNVLYVLLIGTVLTSFFGSIQSTLIRVMDPNEYDALLATLVASFSNINVEIIVFSIIVLAIAAVTATHGNEASFETVVSLDPDYIFVMDRDAAIGTAGASLAPEIMENELIMSTRAYQDGHLVYLDHPGVWYTAEGGVTALQYMLTDLEVGLGLAEAPVANEESAEKVGA